MAAKKYVLSVAVAGALALAGCASATTPATSDLSKSSPSVAASTIGAESPAPAVSAATMGVPAPTAANPIKGCTTGQVNVIVGQGSGAAGTLVQEMDVHNTSAVTCTLKGRPFISPYGKVKQGGTTVEATLNLSVNPIPANFGNLGAAATSQTLTPGDYAVFFLKWSQVPVGSKPCVNADGYDFRTPADSTIQHLITFAFTACGGEIQVSTVMPKSSGL